MLLFTDLVCRNFFGSNSFVPVKIQKRAENSFKVKKLGT